MLKSYLTIALRSILKRKAFSAINIMGLASGLAICMLILTLIRDQNSYDGFHPDADRIYRVISDRTSSSSSSFATAPLPLHDELEINYPAVEEAVRVKASIGADARIGERTVPVRGLWTEPAFLEVFNFPLQYGDPATALREPYSLVLTQEAVEKFGWEDAGAVGRVVELGDWGEYTVTGVLAAFPGKTHFNFELLGSFATVRSLEQAEKIRPSLDAWDDTNDGFVYLLLKEGADPHSLVEAFPAISDQHYAAFENYRLDFRLQPLAAITPSEILENDMTFTIPKVALYFLSILALIVLLTACFNYTNLSVAKALTRAREIGIRKVVGARRSQVFMQFLTESVLVALLALVIGYALLEMLVAPLFKSLFFNQFFDINLEIRTGLMIIFVILAIAVGMIAGALPAVYLSAFRPVRVLQSVSDLKVFSKLGWRKLLIAAQFVVSLIFITTVVILFDQTEFMLNADYGFNKENILNLSLQGQDYQKVRQELARNPDIKAISACSVLPASGSNQGTSVSTPGMDEPMGSHQIVVDYNFMDNLDLELVAGNALIEEGPAGQLVINETLARRLGWPDPAEAIGQPLTVNAGFNGEFDGQITGVVKDYYYLGMERVIGNLVMYHNPEQLRYANLRIQTSDISGLLQFVENTWEALDPVHPVDYRFYDDQIGMIVGVYRDLMKILGFLAVIAIVITSLGILGVATYSVETRTKEVGIRKVLGAGVRRIVWTLSRGLLYPVLAALLLALPLSWFLNRLWLKQIAYHVDLNPLNLGAGLVLLIVLSAGMVGSQAYRLAVRNPADTLRDE
jgi:putative ABC transport system permease protein